MTDTNTQPKEAPETKFDKARKRAAELGGGAGKAGTGGAGSAGTGGQGGSGATPAEVSKAVAEAEIAPKQAKTEDKPAEVTKVEETAIEAVKPAEIDPKTGQLMLTPKHIQLIRTQIAKDATPAEFDLFMMMAYRTRLDPLLKQLYFIKYGQKVSYVTSIDGYRIIAHRTGDFAGVDEPKYDYDKNGKVTHCTITVYKLVQGVKCSFTAKVKFSEYSTGRDNWVKLAETMIAKVAEAHALRKAFPQDLNGIYTNDEMEQAGLDRPRSAQPVAMVTKPQVAKIKELMDAKGVTVEKLKEVVKRDYKRDSIAKLTQKQAGHLIGRMQKLEDVQPVEEAQPEYEDAEVIPGDDSGSFEDFVNSEMSQGEAMPDTDLDLDEIDAGIEAMREGGK